MDYIETDLNLLSKRNYSSDVLDEEKEADTHPGMPRTPSASDKGNPERSGKMNGFVIHSAAGGSSILAMLLVCHPK
jgi:hypothetical protein